MVRQRKAGVAKKSLFMEQSPVAINPSKCALFVIDASTILWLQ